jgi:hypothetical protein
MGDGSNAAEGLTAAGLISATRQPESFIHHGGHPGGIPSGRAAGHLTAVSANI